MSYEIYTTRGIVLSERPVKEADRIYSILTRDFGLVRARALGVRKESSKLRGNLEPVSLSSVSLVRGREYWRATSAEFLKSIPFSPFIARPLALLEKLVQGESANPELFDAVEAALASDFDEESEIRLVASILFHLGYLKESDLSLGTAPLIKVINEGLKASHLA